MEPQSWSPDDSCLFVRAIVGWATPIAATAARRPLTEKDVGMLPQEMRAEVVHAQAAKLWQAELERAAKAPEGSNEAQLMKVVRQLGGRHFLWGCMLLCLHSMANAVARPLLLAAAIRSSDADVPLERALGIGCALAVSLWIESWTKVSATMHAGDYAVLKVVSGLMALTTAKASRLQTGASAEGSEQTIIGRDLIGSAEFARYLTFVVLGLTQLIAGITVLFCIAGAAPAVGLAIMVVTVICSFNISKRGKRFNERMLASAEKGIAITKEIIDGAKVVKMMSWEEAYLKAVAERRNEEIHHLRSFKLVMCLV